MAGKKLDKLIRIWEEAREEEHVGESQGGNYGVRTKAVQGFVEKATAFSAAVGFVDSDVSSPTSETRLILSPHSTISSSNTHKYCPHMVWFPMQCDMLNEFRLDMVMCSG
jgi:hypothetical protein